MKNSKKVEHKVNKIENVTRRRFISTAGLVASAAISAPAILRSGLAYAAGRPIKLGYISPKTGPLAPFAEADDFVIAGIRSAFKDGIKIGSQVHPIEIFVKDTPIQIPDTMHSSTQVHREALQVKVYLSRYLYVFIFSYIFSIFYRHNFRTLIEFYQSFITLEYRI